MLVKITPALLAAAVVLPGACTAIQCSMQTFKANIVQVDAFSAQDLATPLNRNMQSGGWAAITLTGKYRERFACLDVQGQADRVPPSSYRYA